MTINPYNRSREPVYAANGMVTTSQPLASQAGLAMLRAGGNAVDAAIATAVALTVVEPTQNGIGGDAFALVWDNDQLHGLNGSGRMPAKAGQYAMRKVSCNGEMPSHGWAPVTVPGAPAAWADLHARFGRLSFETLFEPAVRYARDGWPLSPVVAEYWRRARGNFAKCVGPEYDAWWAAFFPAGFDPVAGAFWSSPSHADTLERIATSKARAFYEGDLAEAIDAFAQRTGGWLRGEDLAAHRSDWVEPLSCEYRGYRLWEIPPNTQAVAALTALRILSALDLPRHREDELGMHLQIEAMKLGFADTLSHVGDPEAMEVDPEALIQDAYIAERRRLLGDSASAPQAGIPPGGDTVYLAAADSDGMMVSFIQSNYRGFGSGVLVPGTGIALHNRGCGFSLTPGHPNELGPGKRPYHTIMPGFVTTDQGAPVGPFGVMGAFMQPQGHLQMVLNHINYDLHPQAALDAPRWHWTHGRHVRVEKSMPSHVVRSLLARGHEVEVASDDTGFGRGQIIRRTANNTLVGGSDTRADGQVAAY